jgi:hypothetical protein
MRRICRRHRYARQRCGEFITDFAGKRAPTVDLRFIDIDRHRLTPSRTTFDGALISACW